MPAQGTRNCAAKLSPNFITLHSSRIEKKILKKLIFVQLFKKFSAFYGTQGFSTTFITAIH
jgi:hypothetical protein